MSISDHYPIYATISLHSYQKNSNAHKSIKYRSIKHFDQSLVQADLCNSDLIYVDAYSDPSVALTELFNTIQSVLDKHAPIKEKRIKRDHQPEWVTDEIKSLMYQRNKCHKNGLFDQSKVLRNKTASLIRKSKRNYFNKAIEDNRITSVLWRKLKTISNLQQTRQACLPNTIKTVDGRFVEDTLNIENELNKHFINISSIIDKLKFIEDNLNDILQCKLGSHVHVFNIQYITVHEVSRIIYGLNNIKSTGLDEISVQILKYCGDVIVLSINSLIDNSIASGIFPDELKRHEFYVSSNQVIAIFLKIIDLFLFSLFYQRFLS